MENWKDIKNYEGFYQISPYGEVKNTKTGKIIKGDINNIGYRRVTLYAPVKKRFLFIAWLLSIFVKAIKKI